MISVLTCPRPDGVCYVENTLNWIDRELEEASLKETKYLICDREIRYRIGWTSIKAEGNPINFGPANNKYAGWEAIHTANSLGEDLLFLEDDIAPLKPKALIQMLSHTLQKNASWTSFYHPNRLPGMFGSMEFEYSQAILIPKDFLKWLVQLPKLIPEWGSSIGFDTALGRSTAYITSMDSVCKYEQTENLIEHIGAVSIANPQRELPISGKSFLK